MEAGKEEIVTMRLGLRDFSTFDESIDVWKVVEGTFKIYVGTSSNDLPLSIEIERSSLRVDIEVLWQAIFTFKVAWKNKRVLIDSFQNK